MKNWTIGKRITFGFTAILAILAIVAAASFTLLNRIKAHQQDVLGDALPGITAAGQIKYLACEIELSVLRVITTKAADQQQVFMNDVRTQQDQIQKIFDDYEKTITRAEDHEQFNHLATARDAYIKAREPLLDASRAGNDAAVQQLLPAMRSAYAAYLKECDGLFEENSKFGDTAAAASQKAMFLANTLTTVLAIAGISLVCRP